MQAVRRAPRRSTGSPTRSATPPRSPTSATTRSSSRPCGCSASPGRTRAWSPRASTTPCGSTGPVVHGRLAALRAGGDLRRGRPRRSAVGRFFTPDGAPRRDRRPGGHDCAPREARDERRVAARRRTSTPSPATTCRRPTSGRRWSSPPTRLQYPERLNAGAELLDAVIADARAPTARPCAPPTARCGPTASCRPAPTRSRRCSSTTSAWSPATGCCSARPTTRGPSRPGSASSRPAGSSVDHDGGAARDRADPDRREDPTRRSPWSTTGSSRTSQAVRDSVAPDLVVVPYGGDAADDLARRVAGQAGDFTAVDTAADDVALFGPTSGTTGVPKITTHFHRDVLSIDNTFGRARAASSSPTTWSPARPRSPSPSASACSSSSRCAPAPAPSSPSRPRRPSSPTSSPSTASPCWRPLRRRTSRSSPPATSSSCPGLRVAVSRRRAHGAGDVGADRATQLGLKVIDGIGATEMLHIFISAAGDDIRPGATGKPRARLPRRDPRRRTATSSAPGEEGRLARHRAGRAAATSTTSASAATSSTAGTSPATPSSATRTATTSTARAPTT